MTDTYTRRLRTSRHDIHVPHTHPGLQTPGSPRQHFITVTFYDSTDSDTTNNDDDDPRPRVTGILSDSIDLAVFLFRNRRPSVRIHDATDHGPYDNLDGARVLATRRDAVNAIKPHRTTTRSNQQESLTDY